MPAVRQRRNNPPDTPGGRHAECRMPLRVRNQRSAGPLPDDSRRAVCPAPKEPPVGRESPFGVRPFHASSTGPNPCRPLLMRDAPLFQYLFISGKRCHHTTSHGPCQCQIPPQSAKHGKRRSSPLRGEPLRLNQPEMRLLFRGFLGNFCLGRDFHHHGIGFLRCGFRFRGRRGMQEPVIQI